MNKTIVSVLTQNKVVIQNIVLATAITLGFAFIGYFTSVFAVADVYVGV